MSNIKKTQTFNQEMANRLKSFSNLPPTYKGHTKEKNENDSNAIKKKILYLLTLNPQVV